MKIFIIQTIGATEAQVQAVADDLLRQMENGARTDKIEEARKDPTGFCSNSDNQVLWGGPTDESELFRQKVISGLNEKFR